MDTKVNSVNEAPAIKKRLLPPITISSYTLGTEVSFPERVRIAAETGYTGIGLRAENYVNAHKAGLSDEDMLSILKENHVEVTEVEYITGWGTPKDRDESQQEKEQIIFHMARLFGVRHINVGLLEKVPEDQIATALAELCDRSKELIIGVEFMPYSGIPDLATAWRVIQNSHRGNAQIICDSWHWSRAHQSAADLKGIPPEKIVAVQLNDVQQQPYENLREESLHDRLPPGEGFGDTAGMVRALKEHGMDPLVVSVEVISDALNAKGLLLKAQTVYQAAKKVLYESWF